MNFIHFRLEFNQKKSKKNIRENLAEQSKQGILRLLKQTINVDKKTKNKKTKMIKE